MKWTVAYLTFAATLAQAQLVEEYKPMRTDCCLLGRFRGLVEQLQDYNQLGRYYADNARLKAMPAEPKRVVFLGDSITDIWKLDKWFAGKPYVNRGISGQTTPQMLVRMYPDVIALKPAAIIILAGTNDISQNTGPETLEMIADNLRAISELARAHGIKVIICSLLPVSDYTQHPQTRNRPPADILKLNAWLKDYAAQTDAIFADYYAATVDDKGLLKDGFSNDGLHPNDKGYDLMAPVAEAAIQKALR